MRAERAEISPPKLVASPQRNSHPPRWTNPVLAARLTLATLTGLGAAVGVDFVGKLTTSAQAAERTCRVGVRIESYAFFDMAQIVPEMGKRHILDMGIDPRAGSTAGFTVDAVPMSYKAGDREKPGYKPLAATTIVRDIKNNVGRGELRFTAPCNTTTVTSEGKTVPAVKIKLTSNLEDNDQYEQVVGDGRRVPVFYGSEIKKPEDFLRIVDSGIVRVEDFDAKKAEIVRNWLAAQKVAVTGVVTSTTTSRVTTAATSTYTEEVRAALEKVMGDRLDKATRDLQEDLRRQAQTTNTSLGNLNTTLQKQEQRAQELERIILDLKTVISLTVQATAAPTSTVPSGGVLEEIGKLSGRLPVKEVWPWALGILAALGSILGYRSWMPATYNIRGRGIPVHLNIRGRKII